MANTTKENVWKIAPEFKCTSPAIILMVLEDVQGMVGSVYAKKQEIAQRYLAAHILTLLKPDDETRDMTVGEIKQERLGDESVTYFGQSDFSTSKYSDFQSTVYGRMFDMISKRSVPTAMFVTP